MQGKVTFNSARAEDIAPIYQLCRQLILDYEDLANVDLDRVLNWVQKKLEDSIGEYTVVSVDGQKAGYYHFFQNEDGLFELDDLYIFPEFQNKGIGSAVIRTCCNAVSEPVMLYVFAKNHRAVSLYQRLGFEIVETVRNSRYIMKYHPCRLNP